MWYFSLRLSSQSQLLWHWHYRPFNNLLVAFLSSPSQYIWHWHFRSFKNIHRAYVNPSFHRAFMLALRFSDLLLCVTILHWNIWSKKTVWKHHNMTMYVTGKKIHLYQSIILRGNMIICERVIFKTFKRERMELNIIQPTQRISF